MTPAEIYNDVQYKYVLGLLGLPLTHKDSNELQLPLALRVLNEFYFHRITPWMRCVPASIVMFVWAVTMRAVLPIESLPIKASIFVAVTAGMCPVYYVSDLAMKIVTFGSS